MQRFCWIVGIVSLATETAVAGDWPQWRGPEQSGMVRENAIVTKWTTEGENVVWKNDVGGRTAPIILNGRAYVITPVGDGVSLRERVVCCDALTGKTVWEYAFPVFFTDIVENRVGATALAGDLETGNIYAHGTGGELFCFDRDGKVLWKHSLTEEFGRISGYGGRIHTPIIDEDRVVISFTCSSWGEYAKPAHRYYAFDKKTGTPQWSAAPGGPPNDTSNGCPTVAVLGGKRVILAPNVDGCVYAILSRTGETVWKYQFSKRPLNSMPVVSGDRVYLAQGEENFDTTEMGRVVCIDGSRTGELDKSAELWRVNGIEAGFMAPALANGRLYVVDNSANLYALDAATGKEAWKQNLGNLARSAPVVTADGVIYVGAQGEHGSFWILKDAGEKCVVLDQKDFPRTERGLDEMLGSPSVCDGRVYFQTRYSFYCLGVKDAKPVVAAPAAAVAAEKPADADAIARVLLLPAEITLRPGQSMNFNWLPFTGAGRKPEAVAAMQPQFSVVGVKGALTGESFTAAAENVFSMGAVKAKWGEKEATARVRVCPRPPFSVDFENMAVDSVPPGWINVINKTKIVDQNGNKVLQKLAEKPSPPFMRIRAYMGATIAGGYTMEADMLAGMRKTAVKEFWPDMGLMNTRYDLLLMGDDPANARLRLVAWPPIPRIQKEVPLAWKPGIWYRMKFQVKLDGGKAQLRGKVWARDESEPAAWMIDEVDPYPSSEGAPGLYGFSNGTTEKSKGAEIFYDNIKVSAD